MTGRQLRPDPIRVISESMIADLEAACGSVLLQAGARKASIKRDPSGQQIDASMMPGHLSRAITAPVMPIAYTGVISPPSTPPTRSPRGSFSQPEPSAPLIKTAPADFRLDLADSELLGTGLWSNVFKIKIAVPAASSGDVAPTDLLTPPTTPQKASASSVYAVKVASRPDAAEVFLEEARHLSYLSNHPSSSHFIVPFHGLTASSGPPSLLFHCATTDLQTWSSSTPLSALMSSFPSIFTNLISGLAHMHALSLIHADIKPANILLDLQPGGRAPLARFADFSASFLAPIPLEIAAHLDAATSSLLPSPAPSAPPSRNNSQRNKAPIGQGGGTWAFMAPEQLSANPTINEPGYASDVYGLGVTLLTSLMGGQSPYRELEGGNVFLFREAIKMGDALGFVKRDAGLRARLKEVESVEGQRAGIKLVEGVGMAVKKGKADRVGSLAWRTWAVENLGV